MTLERVGKGDLAGGGDALAPAVGLSDKVLVSLMSRVVIAVVVDYAFQTSPITAIDVSSIQTFSTWI